MFYDAIWHCMYASAAAHRLIGSSADAKWRSDLVRLASQPELEGETQNLARAFADSEDWRPTLLRFLDEGATQVTTAQYRLGARLAVSSTSAEPEAKWLLAVGILAGWQSAMGDAAQLPSSPGSQSFQAISELPYACASTSLSVGAVRAAELCLQPAISMLHVASRLDTTGVGTVIEKHANLARDASRQKAILVRNFAESCRQSCIDGPAGSRGHVASLLWALGLVPEAHALSQTADPPTRTLCRALVRESIRYVDRDAILSELWRSLRELGVGTDSEEVLGWLTAEYPARSEFWQVASMWFSPALVARALIGHMLGKLSHQDVEGYLERCRYLTQIPGLVSHDPRIVHPADLIRVLGLGLAMRDRSRASEQAITSEGQASGGSEVSNSENETLGWKWLFEATAAFPNLEMRSALFPARGVGIPLFWLVDQLGEASEFPEEEVASDVFKCLEQLRTVPIAKNLRIHRRLTPAMTTEAGQTLESQRQDAMGRLFTAFLLDQLPRLPLHYQYFEVQGTPQAAEFIGLAGRELVERVRALAGEVFEVELARIESLEAELFRIAGLPETHTPDSAPLEILREIVVMHR